jgi:hypothetical protein
MGVPALEVGYTSATTGRGDHEVRKGHVVALGEKLLLFLLLFITAFGLTPGGSSTVHIYTQTVHRTQRTEHT